jgi:hypothetical protein
MIRSCYTTLLLFGLRSTGLALLGSAVAAPIALAVDSYAISGYVIAGGGTSQSRSACFALAGTLAEPVAGDSASAGSYDILAGFWAVPSSTQDSIFASGIENCGP